jgi:diphosphomevalonate decarboxylase
MRCSDAMHGVMNATSPSIHYLNDTSMRIVEAVREMNEGAGAGLKAAYTFDAGPNAVVFCLDKDEGRVQKAMAEIVGSENIISTKPGPGARVEKVEA